MKPILILFLLISFKGFSQGQEVSDSVFNAFQQNLPIEDIVETLSECDCIVMGMRGDLTPQEQKMISRGQALMMAREFDELDSLFDHGNEIIQLYAFGGICASHPDSLTDKHLSLLTESGKIKMYMQNDQKFPKIEKNEIAQGFYDNVEIRKQETLDKKRVEDVIVNYIKETAAFPETYESLGFSGFHVYKTANQSSLATIDDSEVFVTLHRFKIKNSAGKFGEYEVCFKLDHEFEMMLIEKEESNTVSVNPPKLDWWTGTFGKVENSNEK